MLRFALPPRSPEPVRALQRRSAGAAAVAIITLLAACAGLLGDTGIESLNAAPLCCRTPAELALGAELNAELKVRLAPADPVFLFPSGRGYAYAFSLPAIPPPFAIELRAVASGAIQHPPTGSIGQRFVYPSLLFLDEARRPLVDLHPDELRAACPGGAGCRYTLIGRVDVPPAARFAVLHGLYERIGGNYTQLLVPRIGPPGDEYDDVYYSGASVNVLGRFTATGDVLLVLRRPPRAAAPEPAGR